MSHSTLAPEAGYFRGAPAVHVGTTTYEICLDCRGLFGDRLSRISELINTHRFCPVVGEVRSVHGSPREVFRRAWRWARLGARAVHDQPMPVAA